MNTLSIFKPYFSDNFFDAFEHASPFMGLTTQTKMPTVDVKETSDSYIMEVDLPGYTCEDISVDLKDRVLSIASSREENKEQKENTKHEGQFLIQERVRSSFVRRFTMPEDIDSEQVDAVFKNGVLTLTIPRKGKPAQRQITIKDS